MAEDMIKCPKCGAENKISDAFCAECGEKLTAETQEESKSCNVISSLGSITLTDDYVVQYFSKAGFEEYTCIFLKDISSIKRGYRSNPALLVLGIITILLAFTCSRQFGGEFFMWSLIIGIILIIIFFITRKNKLIISAHDGSKILRIVEGSSKTKEFVNEIIEAKRKVEYK